MKLPKKNTTNKYKGEQVCNYYRRRLKRLLKDMPESQEIKNIAQLIDIYATEYQEDFIYLPNKIVKVKEITDILYYEGLYGKEIYKKENYKKK